jgi:hypothetical protein
MRIKHLFNEEKKKGLDGKACWKGYRLAGTKKKGGKRVDNCVKVKEEANVRKVYENNDYYISVRGKTISQPSMMGSEWELKKYLEDYLKKHPNLRGQFEIKHISELEKERDLLRSRGYNVNENRIQEGDQFFLELGDTLFETGVVSVRKDGFVIEGDTDMLMALKNQGATFSNVDQGEYDDEYGMAITNMQTILRTVIELAKNLKPNENLPEWVQEKLAVAKGMLVALKDYMLSQHQQGRVDLIDNMLESLNETMKPSRSEFDAHREMGPRTFKVSVTYSKPPNTKQETKTHEFNTTDPSRARILAKEKYKGYRIHAVHNVDNESLEDLIENTENRRYRIENGKVYNRKNRFLGVWDGRTYTMDTNYETWLEGETDPEYIAQLKANIQKNLEQETPKTSKPSEDAIKYYANELEKYDQQHGNPVQSRQKYYDLAMQMLSEPDRPMTEAKYQGKEVPLGKKLPGDVKKSKVYVRKPNGKVVKVNFGDKKMRIKKSNPKRRKSFRARHNCKNPGPRWKARYWSCRSW